jgi:uncharacterized protein YggE
MRQPILVLALGAMTAFAPTVAAQPPAPPHIVIVGHGSVKTDPDLALLAFSIRGEGATSDAAATELVRKRAAISDGLAKLLGEDVAVNTGELSIKEARDKACDRDDDQPRLSTGACAIRGFVATVDASVRISPVKDAGTALSLASRLGASDPQLSDFSLRSSVEARRQAEAAAIADAYARALGIATASGSKLGSLISVEDQEARNSATMDIIVTARRREDRLQGVPIVTIDLKPVPIETTATLTVTYAIEP